MMKIVAALALFAAAASAQLPNPYLKFLNKDAVVVDVSGSDAEPAGAPSPLARLTPAGMADAKSFFVSKPFGTITGQASFLRAISACGAGMRLAGFETAAQWTNVLNNLKDVVGVSRNYWVANTRFGGADANDYYLINKGTSVPITSILPGWTAPTPNTLGTNDCVQVKFTAPATTVLAFADCATPAFVLCEMDFASTNPLFDRIV